VPRLFVDTGAFYALADRSDRHHVAARSAWLESAERDELVTTDHVVVESWLLLRARLGRPTAMRWWDALTRGAVTVVGVSSPDLARARTIAEAWPDQDFSLVDCTSFAVLERLGIDRAFAFDAHFRVVRFGPRRERALTLVPS
jgi:predicted nucleic acid-binding protein